MITISFTHYATGATAQLLQSVAHDNPQPLPQPSRPPRPDRKRVTMDIRKSANSTGQFPARSHHQPVRPSVPLSQIPPPKRGDKMPLILAMGLNDRYQTYVQIQVCGSCFHSPPQCILTSFGDLLRTGFERSCSTLGLIGLSHG